MQATVVSSFGTSQTYSREQAFPGEWRVIEPVIELAVTQANVQGAYVYYFDPEEPRASLSAFVGPSPFQNAASKPPEPSGPAVAFHRDRRTPIVLHNGAASDWRFAKLPEFQTGRFAGVLSVPLIAPSGVVGMANFCRTESAAFRAKELAFLIGLSVPLGALLTTETLREELQRMTQLLADRKLLDRAKGLLQAELGWSEEEAYLQIRRLSRRQRTPMRDVARQVIQAGGWSLEASA